MDFFIIMFICTTLFKAIYAQNMYVNKIEAGTHEHYPLLKLPLNSLFDITLQKCFIKAIRCQSFLYGEIFLQDKNTYGSPYRYYDCSVQVTIKDSMSDTWMCEIEHFGNAKRSYLYFDVEVLNAKSPQTLLVNRVVLPLQKHNASTFSTTYNYLKGDYIDLTCLSPDPRCSVQLEYETTDPLFDFLNNTSSKTTVGFRTTLQSEHNSTRVFCKYTCSNKPIATVTLTFVLKSKLDGIANVEINGRIVRGTRLSTSPGVYYNYGYLINEPLRIRCFTENPGYTVATIHPEVIKETPSIGQVTNEMSPTFRSKLVYIIYKNTNASNSIEAEDLVIITFKFLTIIETSQLSINLPSENILLESYKYVHFSSKYLNYIYEYYDGDELNLNCSKNLLRADDQAYIDFNGTVSNTTTNSVSRLIKLTSADNYMSLKCVLYNNVTTDIEGQINILFLMKPMEEAGAKCRQIATTGRYSKPTISCSME
ncbi:uncharacterized protein LOC142980599 isoform X2 [Anticarsia gemmatalis]|uniref:uncharacterized protein LOC142980599 isoform X2 n=1 Tax=Anticarsia gemmatalis TaxID=129554 RepID=UPI003F76BA8F